MSFTPFGVHHATQHLLHQNLHENQEDACGNHSLCLLFCLLKKAYGDESMSQTRVFESQEKFHEGQKNVQDEERLGHASTSHTNAVLSVGLAFGPSPKKLENIK